jgi:hypothetical protein
MLDRHFLDSFLKLNHTSPTMSDEEVSAVLSKAGWSKSEIDSALILLQKGAVPSSSQGNVPFRPDMEFSPSQLSSLLGVDVKLDPSIMRGASASIDGREVVVRTFFGFGIVLVSLSIAALIGLGSMHFLEIGPFAR